MPENAVQCLPMPENRIAHIYTARSCPGPAPPQVVAALARTPGAQLDAPDLQGRTALHLAAARGHSGPVNELWARGAAVDACDLHGWTALHYASRAGHTDVALQLVIAGSLVSACDPHGISAAHLAAERGFIGGRWSGCWLWAPLGRA